MQNKQITFMHNSAAIAIHLLN